MQNLKKSLTVQLKKQFQEAQKFFNPNAQNEQDQPDDQGDEDENQEQLLENFPANFLENILKVIFGVYDDEFERK